MYSLSTSGMAELWFRCFEYYHAYRSGNTFNECLCVVLGAKSVAHLMKLHLLQWEVVKVKFLMNSNMTLTVLNLHQKTDPKVQQDLKRQGQYDKVKSRSHHDAAHLQPLTNAPPCINFLHLPAHPDTMADNNTPTALKGCWVKI